MSRTTEVLIYEMALRVRLYMSSTKSGKRIADLSDRETLILELIATKDHMSISEICKLYPTVSNSTISTTITKLWRDKKLVSKTILPENQRSTVVGLTDAGKKVLEEVRKTQSETFKNVSRSLGLSPEQDEFFHLFIKNAITFFDKKLGLKISGPVTYGDETPPKT